MRGNGGDGSGNVGRYVVHFAWWTVAALLWALGSDGGGTPGGVYGTVLEGTSGGTDVLFFAYLMLGVGGAFELRLLKRRPAVVAFAAIGLSAGVLLVRSPSMGMLLVGLGLLVALLADVQRSFL